MKNLINISNHPSTGWSEAQRAGWDAIYDIPFPSVDPTLDKRGVWELASHVLNGIEKITGGSFGPACNCGYGIGSHSSPDYSDVVWKFSVQGEFSLCSELARSMVGDLVFPCSARESVDNVDGTKTSRFKFVKWREM